MLKASSLNLPCTAPRAQNYAEYFAENKSDFLLNADYYGLKSRRGKHTRGLDQFAACSKSNLLKMKKKTVKTVVPVEIDTSLNGTDNKEQKARTLDGKSENDTAASDNVPNAVLTTSKPVINTKSSKGLSQQFLDLFWKLADKEASIRLTASLEIIKHIESALSSASQLNYTIGRLVQGLASNRECARHGYYITLVGILKALDATQLTNQIIHEAIKNRLGAEGNKKERIDQHVGQVLAYGALLKSGRLNDKEEMLLVINQLIIGSKIKNYIQPVAYGFLEELCQKVDAETFKGTVWPLLKPELSLPWGDQTFDTLNLLLVAQSKFPKIVDKRFWKETFGSSNISKPECFSELTTLILTNSSSGDHPLFAKIAKILFDSGKLLDFWSDHFDPALEFPTNLKSVAALTMFNSLLKIVDDDMVGKLLLKSIVSILVTILQAKEDSNFELADKTLESIKTVLAKEDISPDSQISIIEQLFNLSGHVAFDKNTNTRFIANVSFSLKKETIVKIVEMYRQFVNDSSRTQDKITLIQHLTKLISHPAMQRDVEWKASQLVFLAQWAYFTPSASKVFSSAAKETFHRALDHPCKKLEDLSTFLSKSFDQVNKLVDVDGEITDEVKAYWKNLKKVVEKIQKKNRTTKETDSWTGQVFLVLYINMGFELLRQPALPSEIIAELDTCYSKATENSNRKTKAAKAKQLETPEDPHWLEVVTDILLSLLSRNQHLLRSIVVSVWSLLAEHVTPNALQQVLDVIDPSKKDTPLVDADEEDEDLEDSDLSDEEESPNGEKEANEESEIEEEDDGDDECSDGMDEEETITDKLRMKIHEALGDSAALTDTESVDIDDLSDGQMESLDKALGSAFQEFRKARPVRKNVNKLPKEGTALMHFRLRCLDLIEVLTDKELSISLSAAAMMPLLSLLEVTVKEPLQKPLMDRTRSVLRKLTNIRRFSDSKDVVMEDLVKLLQILFSKPYAKKTLMPYISEDLVQCCSFILRCTLHLSRVNDSTSGQKKQKEPHVEVDGVYQLYRSNLSKFFLKRDSHVPFGVFSRALVFPWPDAGFLLESLIEYAFGPTILKNRKLLAVQLLTALFRNSTAVSAIGEPLLTKRLHSLLQCSQRVVEEAGSDSKPKYLNELFILLRVVLLCPEVAKLRGGSPTSGGVGTDDGEPWKPFKDALTVFTAKGLGKQKDLKKNHSMLARLMGLALDEIEPAQACGGGGSKRLTSSSSSPEADGAKSTKTTTNGSKAGEMATKKKLKSNRPGDKEKKEAKKRRMTASGEGFGGVTFAQVDMDIDVAPEAEPSSSVVAKEKVGERKKRRKDSETMKAGSHDTNGNQVEQEVGEEEKGAKSKKEKKKKLKKKDKNSVEEVSEDVPTAAEDASAGSTTPKKLKKRQTTVESTTDDRRDETTDGTPSPAKKKKKRKSTID
ncbi:myb-binding protein 1A-like protein [Daphnia magna]|uniref:myb-binding protein 1A-like protein n=1 Tax=Daphnia magna TaxID=35525 RepID=UPI001E1BC5F7|nr:myb-binding protein 1A-like protein [Daphnia magna]